SWTSDNNRLLDPPVRRGLRGRAGLRDRAARQVPVAHSDPAVLKVSKAFPARTDRRARPALADPKGQVARRGRADRRGRWVRPGRPARVPELPYSPGASAAYRRAVRDGERRSGFRPQTTRLAPSPRATRILPVRRVTVPCC